MMYKSSSHSWIKHADFLLFDFICLELSFFGAYFVYNNTFNLMTNDLYRNLAFILMFVEIFVLYFLDSFKNVLKRGYYKEFLATIKHVFLVILIITFYMFATKTGDSYSRIILILTGCFYLSSSYAVRLIWKKYLYKKQRLSNKRSLIIITCEERLNKILDNIKKGGYGIASQIGLAVIDKDMVGQDFDGVEVLANQTTVVDYVCHKWVDEVYINLPEKDNTYVELTESFLEMGITLHQKIDSVNLHVRQKQYVEKLGTATVLTTSINAANPGEIVIKRLMDICGGFIGCIMTGILFLFIAPCIYIKSPGPIFFSQERIGKNGKHFKMYKFRSMYMDAEERKKDLMDQNSIKDGMMFKMDNDPRIIQGIGHFIRKTSIDEFPQFFNVLKGDMSLVGTRPPTVDEWEKYKAHHRARMSINPGITGLWQVSGRSDITDFEEVVRLDTDYISKWNLGLDIKILLKTVQVVFMGKGSK